MGEALRVGRVTTTVGVARCQAQACGRDAIVAVGGVGYCRDHAPAGVLPLLDAQSVAAALRDCARRKAERELPALSLRVLHMLEREWRSNGGWPVQVRTLGRLAGCSVATCHKHLGLLVAAGLLEKGPGRYDGWRPR